MRLALVQMPNYGIPNLYLLEKGRTYDASIFIDKNGEIKGTQKLVLSYALTDIIPKAYGPKHCRERI